MKKNLLLACAVLFSVPAFAAESETVNIDAELEQSCLALYQRGSYMATGRICYPKDSATAGYYSDLTMVLIANDPDMQRCAAYARATKDTADTPTKRFIADFAKRYSEQEIMQSPAKTRRFCSETEPLRKEVVAYTEALIEKRLPEIVRQDAERRRAAGEEVSEQSIQDELAKARKEWEETRAKVRAEQQNRPAKAARPGKK